MNHRYPSSLSRSRFAFTLVELMISVALVLILVIGINQVFSLTSKTVGTGQASSAIQRDMRAAQRVMSDDFANALTSNGPFFMIYSRQVYAFRNKTDQLSDRDGLVNTQDVQNLGTNPEPSIPVPVTSGRSHRVDMIRFFARGDYHRQTGDLTSLVSTTSSGEAMVTYGHGQLPDNTGAFSDNTMPGAGTQTSNPNNYYASQWVLTREAMLLKPAAAETAYRRSNPMVSPPDLTPLSKLTPPFNSVAKNASISTTSTIESSRFDLADASIDGVGADLAARLRAGSALTAMTPPVLNVWYRVPASTDPISTGPWATVFPPASRVDLLYRMQCNPFITRPLNPTVAALTSPYFVGGCSQFIVEFAGDFVAQDNDSAHVPSANPPTLYGQVIGNHSDGVLDYFIDANNTRQIRWYGFPRDVDNSGMIRGIIPTGAGHSANELNNVVPVRDVLATAGFPAADFEKEVTPSSSNPPSQSPGNVSLGIPQMQTGGPNYEGMPAPSGSGGYADSLSKTQMPTDCSYLCLWNYGGPQMIRITVTVEDPNGRLPDGQTFEYVFTLKK